MGVFFKGEWIRDKFEFNLIAEGVEVDVIDLKEECIPHFAYEEERYHLYVSEACPFCHRILIALKLLEVPAKALSISTVRVVRREEEGWEFDTEPGSKHADPVNGFSHVRSLYEVTKSDYTGRCTLPVLWDKKNKRIVSSSSMTILKIINSKFRAEQKTLTPDLFPDDLRDVWEPMISWVESDINFGVYKTGFSMSQDDYDRHSRKLYSALDKIEKMIGEKGTVPWRNTGGGHDSIKSGWTVIDVMLLPTLVRFDSIYHYHFKCTKYKIVNSIRSKETWLELYLRVSNAALDNELVKYDEVAKEHYYKTHALLNPTGIVPEIPPLSLSKSECLSRELLGG